MTMFEKMKRLRELIQQEESLRDLNYSARIIGSLLDTDLFIANRDGHVLAAYQRNTPGPYPRHLHPTLRQRLLPIAYPEANLRLPHAIFKDREEDEQGLLTISPLIIEGIFWGSLLLIRKEKEFVGDELLLVETAALASGIILSRRVMPIRILGAPIYSPHRRDAQVHEQRDDKAYAVSESTEAKVEVVS